MADDTSSPDTPAVGFSSETINIMDSHDAVGETINIPPPRLLDVDTSKFRSLKQVIVIGRPGSGVDGESTHAVQLFPVTDSL